MQELMHFAADLARLAGDEAMAHFGTAGLDVGIKADDSPVTIADRRAEMLVRARIRKMFPDDGIVGEEHGDIPTVSGRTWYIDPIDGTKSFVHGVPLFTNLIACHDPDGPLVGVINTPALHELTVAGRGEGCLHNDVACRVSDQDDPDRAYLMTSGLEWWPEELLPIALDSPFTVRTWGDGYGYSLVATGRVEAMMDPEASPWDLAPMAVIIEEAGGRFSGVDGHPDMHGGSALATNGHVHDVLLRTVADLRTPA